MKDLASLSAGLRHTFFGWWVLGGSILLQVLVAGLLMQAYGTYVAVWRAEFGWSKTTFATAFAIFRGQMALISPVQGWLLKRFGARAVIQVGLVVMAGGFFLLARIDTIAGFYATFLVMSVGAGLAGFLSVTTVVVNWFERRRSTALALMQMGISIGGLGVPAVAWALTTFGWRPTAVASGLLILLVGLPATKLMRRSPEAYGLRPYGADDMAEPVETRKDGDTGRHTQTAPDPLPDMDFSAREALRTRAFWFITFGHSSAVTIVAAVIVHLVVHLQEGVGLSLQVAATVVAIMTAATMLGQLVGGVLGDRFNKRFIAVVAMLAHAVALLAVTFATGMLWVLFFAVVHGLAWGMRGPIMQAMRADYFGRSSFSTIMGISFSFVMMGQIAGPLLAGALADATGDYRLGFILLAAFVAAASLFFVFATPPRRPVR